MSRLSDILEKIIEQVNNSVKKTKQELTPEEKAQVRENLGIGDVIIEIPQVPEIPVTSVNKKTGDVELQWSDLGEVVVEDVEVLNEELVSSSCVGKEGTTLSVGDTCVVTSTGIMSNEEKTVLISENYSFYVQNDMFKVIYNKQTNTYNFEWQDTELPPVELQNVRIVVKGHTDIKVIDEKFLPENLARISKDELTNLENMLKNESEGTTE